MKNRAEIKLEAKGIIRTARVSPILMGAIVLVISFVLERVVSLVEYGTLFPVSYLRQYLEMLASGDPLYGMDPDAMLAMAPLLPEPTTTGFFFSILVGLFVTLLSAGFYIYCMGIRQGVEMPYATLLDGLGAAGRIIWCSILMSVKVFLWSLLFGIPGIIAAYRYRFAIYNILTDSSLSASQAIRLSCEQTYGMKWRLFVLDLSFIGWSILSSFTMGILEIWLLPYITLCDLAYFEEAQLRLGRSPYGGPQGGSVPPSWES